MNYMYIPHGWLKMMIIKYSSKTLTYFLYSAASSVYLRNLFYTKFYIMKKILRTLVTGLCLSSVTMAQEPAKTGAKKKNVSLTAASTSAKDDQADMAERLKAKQKHFESLKAASAHTPASEAKHDDLNGFKKKKAN